MSGNWQKVNSHVCLVWLNREKWVEESQATGFKTITSRGVKPAPNQILVRPDISPENIKKIERAVEVWHYGGHSVSVWILDPTPNDMSWMKGLMEDYDDVIASDLKVAFDKYGYLGDYDTIDQDGDAGSDMDYIYYKIDLAKMLVPSFVLEGHFEGVQCTHCIVSDLDVGTTVEDEFPDTFVSDIDSIYDEGTKKVLDDIGAIFAEAPTIGEDVDTVKFENSFAIFKNEEYVRESLLLFMRAIMDDICFDQYTPEVVWSRIPILFRLLEKAKDEKLICPRGGLLSRVAEYLRSQKRLTCELTFNSFLRDCIDFEKVSEVDVPVKKIPIPVSRFAVEGAGRGGGTSDRQYDGFTAAGLAVLTFALAFAKR